MKLARYLGAAILAPVFSLPANAAPHCDLQPVIGYTLVAVRPIVGRIDGDGRRGDDYEGCESGRILVFLDGTGVQCIGYLYQYVSLPEAAIWAQGSSIKLCVEGEYVDVMRIR